VSCKADENISKQVKNMNISEAVSLKILGIAADMEIDVIDASNNQRRQLRPSTKFFQVQQRDDEPGRRLMIRSGFDSETGSAVNNRLPHPVTACPSLSIAVDDVIDQQSEHDIANWTRSRRTSPNKVNKYSKERPMMEREEQKQRW
jgi:hypothetical protein